MDGFRITQGKGFYFAVNGWVLSVQFGAGNRCDYLPTGEAGQSSPDAEIAIWRDRGQDGVIDHTGTMLQINEYDPTVGHVSPLTIAKILGLLASPLARDITTEGMTTVVRAFLHH